MTGTTAYRPATPWLDDGDLRLYHGDVLEVLRGLPAGIAQMCVTSPPYWGLRDYGTGTWTGGDEACDHLVREDARIESSTLGGGKATTGHQREGFKDSCPRCGAARVDDQLGLEPTPALYIERMVEVFRLVRRVLRDDGTLWLNIGDSYNANQGAGFNAHRDTRPHLSGDGVGQKRIDEANRHTVMPRPPGLKPKDLVGIPWRLALALQADGWYLRSDIIWSKPNPMPESVTDRPTKAHEYVFLFSKQPRYFYDADAVREPATYAGKEITLGPKSLSRGQATGMGVEASGNGKAASVTVADGRNLRSVWQIATQPFPEAHFATYPEELVRRCIQAGTSERGGCAECGAPWRRIVEHSGETARGRIDRLGPAAYYHANGNGLNHAGHHDAGRTVTTTGWEPSCTCCDYDPATCQYHKPTPQLVLDPFVGSGTTALVARKHGRRSIGIDLSAEYLAIAAKRTQQLSLLGGAA